MNRSNHLRWRTIALGLTGTTMLLASAVACGGDARSNDDSSNDAGNTSEGPDGGPVTTGGPDTNGGPVTTGVVTTGGGGTGSLSCPSVEPAEGSGCTDEEAVCSYGACVAPDYRDIHVLDCTNGAWAMVAESVCDPPPEYCPAGTMPGDVCLISDPASRCWMYDACGTYQTLLCVGGYWDYDDGSSRAAPAPGVGGAGAGDVGTAPSSTIATGNITTGSTMPVPYCPEAPPILGTACCPSSYPEYCDYRTDGSATSSSTTGQTSVAVGAGGSAATTGGAAEPGTAVAGSGTTGGVTAAVVSGTGGFAMGTGAGTTVTITNTTSGTTGGVPASGCVACGPSMVWEYSAVCP